MFGLNHVYDFIGGTFVGKFLGIIPSVIISGMMMYIVDNTIFTTENIMQLKYTVFNMTVN